MKKTGIAHKMRVDYSVEEKTAQYFLRLGQEEIALNSFLGKRIKLEHTGQKNCIYCSRKINKTFNQGYCFPCVQKLARCDMCIVKPEKCHFHLGTCREPSWGEQHCFIPHTLYLSNTSSLKVGITRTHQQMTRWIDQGASWALAVAQCENRLDSGKLEVALKDFYSDKTNWQAMLKSEPKFLDLKQEVAKLRQNLQKLPVDKVQWLDSEPAEIRYPVVQYPTKITSYNLDKTPGFESILLGIKAQYLITESGVINIRKYAGYELSVELSD